MDNNIVKPIYLFTSSLFCNLVITSTGSVRLGSSGGNSFRGVAFVIPFQPTDGSAFVAHLDKIRSKILSHLFLVVA